MQRPDYESLRCYILYPEIDRIIKARDVNNLSHENLKNLLKNIHYSYLCEADEAMYDEIVEDGSSFRRARSYARAGYHSNGGVIHTPSSFSYSTGSYVNNSNNGSYGYNQRSGHSEEEMFMEELKAMMSEAKSPKVKEAIQETMQGMMR